MWKTKNVPVLLALALIANRSLQSRGPNAPPSHVFFRVQAAASLQAPLNGRLLIFVSKGSGDKTVDFDMLQHRRGNVRRGEAAEPVEAEAVEPCNKPKSIA
jgi:hypothetical protein